MNLQEARQKIPALQGLDDQSTFDVIHQVYYPTWDRNYLAQQLNYTPPAAPVAQAGVLRTVGDIGIKLAQGGVGLGSAAVGVGSLATGGLVGKGMRAIGYDPQRTNAMLGEYLSDSQKAADAKVHAADGFVDTVAAAVQNPRAILGSVAESAPGMLAGMGITSAVARGLALKAALATGEGAAASAAQLAAGKTAAQAGAAALETHAGKQAGQAAVDAASKRLITLGAATEGAQGAGQIADDAQAAGRAYGDYALPAATAGAITTAIGLGSGKLFGDAATEIATGARSAGMKGSLAARIAKGAAVEGIAEEMPQSGQEQFFTNIAQGEADTLKGVGAAAGLGMVTGAAMGAGMGGFQGGQHAPQGPQNQRSTENRAPSQLPNTGPLSQAANAGQQAAQRFTGMDALLDAARGENPSLAREIAQKQVAQALPEVGPSFQQLLQRSAIQPPDAAQDNSDNNILNSSERQKTPFSLRYAQALVEHAKRDGKDFYVVPHAAGEGYLVLPSQWLSPADKQAYQSLREAPRGSFSQINELAEFAQQEKQDLMQQRAAIEAQQAVAQQTRQQQELSAQLQDTDARVQTAQAQAAQQERMSLLDTLLTSEEANGKNAAQLKRAFSRQLQQQGVRNIAPDAHELEKIERFIALRTTLNESAPVEPVLQIPSPPNEWQDAVPERVTPTAPTGEVNFNAVDTAIAAGMRLRQAGGNLLHKKGSSKVFRLNAAQKAYYLEKMQQEVAAQRVPESAPETAPETAHELAVEPAQPETSDLAQIPELAETLQAPSVHIEAGQAEPASVPVITQSLAKAAKNTQMGLRQVRHNLLAAVDLAMKNALSDEAFFPFGNEVTLAENAIAQLNTKEALRTLKPKEHLLAMTAAERRLKKAKSALPMVTIDVAGDGKFTVINSRAHLSQFRQRAANSPGFTGRQASDKPAINDSKLTALRAMLADGDLANAYHFAELIEQPFRFGMNSAGQAVPYAEATDAQLPYALVGFIGRSVESYAKKKSDWEFIEQTTGQRIGRIGKNRQHALENALESLQRVDANRVSQRLAELPKMDAPALVAYWLAVHDPAYAQHDQQQAQTQSPSATDSLPAAVPVSAPKIAEQAEQAAQPDQQAPTSLSAQARKQQLNRKTVKDMSDDELMEAREVFADHQRAPKIEKEIKLRGLVQPTTHVGHAETDATILARAPVNATKAVDSSTDSSTNAPSTTVIGNENEHQHRRPDGASRAPLAGMATEQSSGIGGNGGTGASTARRGSVSATGSPASDALPTLPRARSTGGSAATVHSASTGSGRERRAGDGIGGDGSRVSGAHEGHVRHAGRAGGVVERGSRPTDGALSEAESRKGGRGSAANTPASGTQFGGLSSDVAESAQAAEAAATSPIPASTVPAINFRIRNDLRLGQGGEVGKFQDNLQAIRSLQAIEREHRRATPEEQYLLARYVGWGGLANAFPSPESGVFKPAWEARGQELAQLLTPKEYAQARRSTLDAHYTSQTVVQAMWEAARHLGFGGGLVLEPALGSGNFIGLLPDSLHGRTRFVGVELDSLTARIASQLYPQETVLHSGLQKVPLPDNAFDLAIGNPPFGEQSLRFQFKPEFNGQSIHNQFFLAALDAVKPGGLLVQVVSRYLLDKQDNRTRIMLSKKARLLGAIRLPDSAFKENARTEVVTDIVFLQRLSRHEQEKMENAYELYLQHRAFSGLTDQERQDLLGLIPDWINTSAIADPLGGTPMVVNRYFAENPQMIMGVLERSGSMQYRNDITVRLAQGEAFAQMLAQAIQTLPQSVMVQEPSVIAIALARHKSMSDSLQIALNGWENGSLRLNKDGQLEEVIEREAPEGGFELGSRLLSPESPWSEHLFQNADGHWTKLEVARDADGNAIKQEKQGKVTRLNLTTRQVFTDVSTIPASMLLGQSRHTRLRQMIALRDALVAQINLETQDAESGAMEANRARLREAYHAFIKKHGLINDPANAALVARMPDGALILALESSYRPAVSKLNASRKGEVARPSSAKAAPILSKRVIEPYVPAEHAETMADALSITLAEMGKVDLPRIAQLLGRNGVDAANAANAVAELEEQLRNEENPLVFFDPESAQWETRDVYLSGQVRRKLNAAIAANLPSNIRALTAVQPESWTADQVTALLGSTWIPPEVYQDFIHHLTDSAAKVKFAPLTNMFHVEQLGRSSKSKEDEWDTPGYAAAALVSAILNSQTIKVSYRDSDGKTHFDKENTQLAVLKARAITAEFDDWVFRDGARRDRLVELFNEKFNTRVTRQYDGSHLILPGKVPDTIIAMRRHQKNAIWRGVFERFLLLDHAVGAGKTFTAIAIAMERRRMGLSKKPLIVVPNHMVEQFTADTYRLYPAARVLAAGKKDFERSRRRRLFAKIATGEYDIIIVPHSSFGFIDIAPETQERYLEEQLKNALEAVKEAQEEAEQDAAERGVALFRKPFTVKEAERLVAKIQESMEKIKLPKDRLLTFEQMGIDYMAIDEAHEFKNLFYSTRLTGVKGMGNKTGSQKALDLYNKVRVLAESPTGAVTFMTGTPISNSAVEMYTMMRYLAAPDLRELNLEHFDAWRAQFVSADVGWEPTETGRLQEVTRLGRTWSNMRSLMDLYYSFTDSVDNEDIKRAYAEDNNGAQFPIPPVKGGERQAIVMPPTKAQHALLGEIMQGFDGLSEIKDPYDRNKQRLRLMDQARKVSLDVRVIDPSNASVETGGKLDVVAQHVHRLYQQWDADKGTQLIFLDRSVPKSRGDDQRLKTYDALLSEQERALMQDDEEAMRRVNEKLEAFDGNEMESLRRAQKGGWNAYQQIKDNLIARGIPANEIRFVQEATDDEQKKALFDAVNEGDIRVLIGSTPRMGAGTNVQQRLVGLHHVDVTWKPSDIEQREGRIIRQGNHLLEKYGFDQFAVEILAYATERTIDAKMWALNSAKLKTINGIRKYDGSFVMEFEDEESVGMAELAALASGDPLLLERVKLDAEIDKLNLLKRQFKRRFSGIQQQTDMAQRDIERLPAQIERAISERDLLETRFTELEQEAKARQVVIEGTSYSEHSAAQKAIKAAIERQQAGDEESKFTVQIGKRRLTSVKGAMDALADALGDAEAFALQYDGKTYISRLDAGRDLAKPITAIAEKLAKGEADTIAIGSMLGLPLEASIEFTRWENYQAHLAVLHPDGSSLVSAHTAQRQDPHFSTNAIRDVLTNIYSLLDVARGQYRIEQMQARLQQAHQDLPGLLEKSAIVFPQQDELIAKTKRLNEVIGALSGHKTVMAPNEQNEHETSAPEVGENADSAAKPSKQARLDSAVKHSLASLLPALQQALRPFGKQFADNLLATGKLKLITQAEAGQMLGATSGNDAPIAFFYPPHKVSYLIADALPLHARSKDLRGLVLHEVANHALHLGRTTQEFSQLLKQFALMRVGNPKVQAAFARAQAAGANASQLQEEALGYFLEANPDLSFSQKVLAWLRKAIRALGKALPLMQRAQWFAAIDRLAPNDLIFAAQQALKAAPATLAQEDGRDSGQDAAPAFSKQAIQRLLVSVWKTIASAQDAYQYPASHAKELPQIARSILPDMQVRSMDQSHPKARSTASRQWQITMPDGRLAYAYEFGRDLQLDVSQLQSGSSRGSALYAALANYAYNTGKIFEGDSAGLSLIGQMRRLDNMLSSALKFGTTAHMRPHPEQKNPSDQRTKALGLHGISWATGDDEHNIAQMLQASYDAIHTLIPEIEHVRLTEYADFIGADGDLFADDSFRQLSRRATRVLHQRMEGAGITTTAEIGSTALKRAAITGTLLRGESSAQGRQLLVELGRQLRTNIGQAQEILYSKSAGSTFANIASKISAVQLPANYLLGDLFHQSGKESGKLSWWHKSIGTMDNLAKRYPAFTPVYASVQHFLGDVSRFAVSAADLAPTLLPKLEDFADILGRKRKHPLTAQDVKAIAAPIFEGTLLWGRDEAGIATKISELEDRAKQLSTVEKAQALMRQGVIAEGQNKVWAKMPPASYASLIEEKFAQSQLQPGVVWQDAELTQLFDLNSAQIGMYREFRAAIDQSLTNLALSEMLRIGGEDVRVLRAEIMASDNLLAAVTLIKQHFAELIDGNPSQERQLLDSLQQIMAVADKGMQLQLNGYAPLSRFGQYTVYVEESGQQAYFGMFETRIEAAKMARRMREAYPQAEVTQGTVSEEAYKLFSGISPETIELFGKLSGLDAQLGEKGKDAYQTYLQLAKSNRSAMKRLIHRKGIAGFNEDAGRVLANFIYSNARLTAANLHLGELDAAITDIPQQQGQLVDAAMDLRGHITNPHSGGTVLSGLMFAQYLGGSIASALVNMTQPLTMSLPFLSQYGGVAKAGKRLLAAMRLAGKDSTGDDNLNAALKWATDKGIVAPQEVHYLLAQASGKAALLSGDGTWLGDNLARYHNIRSKLMVGWGKPFAMAELLNRRVTFIAAYRTAQEQGIPHPARFAQEAVAQTQGVYNTGNKPRWARNPVGGLAMTFKQYAIAYVELLARMAFAGKPGSPERAAGRRGALTMLAVLFLLSGMDGLPFEKDIEDAIDGLLQRMGYNFSGKRAKQAFLTEVLGDGGAEFVLKGVSSIPGMPIDVSGRLGMGNLIPATGLLTKKASYTADLGELAGPAGDMAKRSFNAAGKALDGDFVEAMFTIAPLSVRNARQGADMLNTGTYHDARGYKVGEVTPLESIMKIIGFQPESIAQIQDAKGQALNMISQTRMRSAEIQEHWAQGILQGDQVMIDQARVMRSDWNAKNPETPIKVNMPGIARRVRAMREDAMVRTQKTAPQALRQSVGRELQQL